MQIIKVKYLKGEVPNGRDYTFYSSELVKPGDLVQINSAAKGVVTEVDVTESEIEAFKDKIKTIVGIVNNQIEDALRPVRNSVEKIKMQCDQIPNEINKALKNSPEYLKVKAVSDYMDRINVTLDEISKILSEVQHDEPRED